MHVRMSSLSVCLSVFPSLTLPSSLAPSSICPFPHLPTLCQLILPFILLCLHPLSPPSRDCSVNLVSSSALGTGWKRG